MKNIAEISILLVEIDNNACHTHIYLQVSKISVTIT